MTEPASDKLIAAIEAVATNSFEISNASAFALVARIRQQDAEIGRLREAHERIAEANQRSINVWSAVEALAWCHAVSEEALKGGEA